MIDAPNTWSKEALALREALKRPAATGFLNYERRALLLLALKTALAAGLSYWLARMVGWPDGYWGSISAIIVLQSSVGSTVNASRDRLIGTLIGAAFGGAFSFLGEALWVYLTAVITAMVTCSLMGLKNSSRLAGVTVTIILLVHRTGSNWTLPTRRVAEVLLGIVLALGVSTLVFPSRARLRLRDGLAQEFLLLGAVFDAVIAGFHDRAVEDLPGLWKDTETIRENNAELLAEARNEPTGGQASVESLSLLNQFGNELIDGLRALDLASASGSGSSFAAKLNPELGRFTDDIRRGFEYLAGCIHRWKFGKPPASLSLEGDVTALEAKMAVLRPIVPTFPQEEIFRAYAMQLHLKQLARLLRAARIETERSIA